MWLGFREREAASTASVTSPSNIRTPGGHVGVRGGGGLFDHLNVVYKDEEHIYMLTSINKIMYIVDRGDKE